MTKRKTPLAFALLLVSALFLGGGCVPFAQESPKEPVRIGIISGAPPFEGIATAFKNRLAELGYIEGENVIYDLRNEGIDQESFAKEARTLVEEGVDMIFTFPTGPTIEAKRATEGTGIPVVFAMAGIEGNDFVESVARPGSNATGVRYPSPEFTGKWLEILMELAPSTTAVYVPYDPEYPTIHGSLPGLRESAARLGVTLVEEPIATRDVDGLNAALAAREALPDGIGADAMMIMPDILTHSPEGFGAIVAFAEKHDLPLAGGMKYTADLGAMFSYVADNEDKGHLAADTAERILRGEDPAIIPVLSPQPRLRLNETIITRRGLVIPEALVVLSTEIIR